MITKPPSTPADPEVADEARRFRRLALETFGWPLLAFVVTAVVKMIDPLGKGITWQAPFTVAGIIMIVMHFYIARLKPRDARAAGIIAERGGDEREKMISDMADRWLTIGIIIPICICAVLAGYPPLKNAALGFATFSVFSGFGFRLAAIFYYSRKL